MSIISKYGQELYFLLIDQGFLPETAKMIVAQAAHESGNFSSPVFLFNNNPFGMKLPESRRTTAIGEDRGHAVYENIAMAVQDYWLYYNAKKYPLFWSNIDMFVETLKMKQYFEAPVEVYKEGVKYFYKLYYNE